MTTIGDVAYWLLVAAVTVFTAFVLLGAIASAYDASGARQMVRSVGAFVGVAALWIAALMVVLWLLIAVRS